MTHTQRRLVVVLSCCAAVHAGCSTAARAAGIEAMRPDPVMIPAGMYRACTNPAAIGGGAGVLSASIWSTMSGMPFPDDAVDPWVSYPDFHTAICGDNATPQIDEVDGDPRMSPSMPQQVQMASEVNGVFALHTADFNYVMGDLLRIVAAQGAAM